MQWCKHDYSEKQIVFVAQAYVQEVLTSMALHRALKEYKRKCKKLSHN